MHHRVHRGRREKMEKDNFSGKMKGGFFSKPETYLSSILYSEF
jgi:hypothetical protein